ncbi:MAG: hypothetical protein WCS56_04250, partial [Bacilli bacterium]
MEEDVMYNMDDMGDIAYAKAKKNSEQIAHLTQQKQDKFQVLESRPSLEDLDDGELAFYVGGDNL